MLKFDVEVFAAGRGPGSGYRTVRRVSLVKAWRIANREARKGLKRFGGTVTRYNWGLSAGTGFGSQHSVTIRNHR